MLAVGFSVNGTLIYISESVLAGGGSYFLKRAMEIRPLPGGGFSLSTQETACVIITACVFFMSLSVFSVKGFVRKAYIYTHHTYFALFARKQVAA
jgi:hypothetical protein